MTVCLCSLDFPRYFFPPTSFQIANIQAGTGASNVIPGELKVQFNFRFSTELTEQMIRDRVAAILDRHQLEYSLTWSLSGHPFLTPGGELVEATRAAVSQVNGAAAELSTSGSTSDGRFIARTGAEVLELGPVNATIHKLNECVKVADLEALTDMYTAILHRLLA